MKTRASTPVRRRVFILILTTLMMSACGQKGPLFLPESDVTEHQSESRFKRSARGLDL